MLQLYEKHIGMMKHFLFLHFLERSLYRTRSKYLHSIIVHVSSLKRALCKLRYIHAVNDPLQSMPSGFQGEVGFTLVPDILFVYLNSCF